MRWIYLAVIILFAAATIIFAVQNFEIVTMSFLGINARVPLAVLVAVAYLLGAATGGNEGARAALDSDWRRVSKAAAFSPLQRSPFDRLMGRWPLDPSPAYVAMDLMARVVSPYDLNPLGLNPLRSILDESIDFDRLARAPIKLFVTATNVRTCRGHIFRNK